MTDRKETDRQVDWRDQNNGKEKEPGRHANRQRDKQTDRKRNKYTDRQKKKECEGEAA